MCEKCYDKAVLAYFANLNDACAICRFWNRTNTVEQNSNECREGSPRGSFDITAAATWCGKFQPIPGLKAVKCKCETTEE